MKKVFIFLAAIYAVMLVSSSNGQNFIQVNRTNQEQTINLSTDQVLEIQLPRKASTGYIWCEATTSTDKVISKSVAQIGEGEFIHDATQGRLKGGSGTQIIRYVGTSQGTTVLSLELRRPWEKNSPAIDSYTISVVSEGKYTGTYKPPVKEIKTTRKTATPVGYPSSWDWRSKCTPVTDQQNCGDCWAFAGVGVFEAVINIIDSNIRDISEEWLTNCYTGNGCGGCGGGANPQDAWLSPQGAVYESEDPWTSSEGGGTTGACGGPYAFHEAITSHANVPGCWDSSLVCAPDSNIKKYMYNYGPIFTYIDASSSAFSGYTGGILTETGSSNTDHCVVIVGWCDSAAVPGGGYWIIKNSWNTGWGINGYLYISYGSDWVGQGADYLVYTTNILPPVANFTASATTSCTGDIQFTDISSNSPTSWLWSFGDGDTSNLENPSHNYTATGTYSVSLTAYNSFGDSTLTKTSYVTINLLTAPTVTPGSTTLGGSVTLYASGLDTLDWYNAPSGGTLVNTGTSFTISPLDSTETFYVENDIIHSSVSSVGMTDSTTNGSNYTGSRRHGLMFDTYIPLTIDSVTVYESTAGSRTIFLENSSGTDLDSVIITTVTGKQTIALNFSVPAGTGYMLGATSACYLWRETSGAAFPYTVPSVISITGSNSSMTGYYYFYNWIIGYSTTCSSVRVPVIATVTNGINEISEGSFAVFPNPNTGSFDIKLFNQNIQNATISITNVLGQTLLEKNVMNNNSPIHIDAENIQQGMYYLMIKTEKGVGVEKFIKE
ncbi:MAG: C1 family peptidase [Bacteroidales bacterium]|jgi:C1A family cysteine protease